MRFLVGWSFPLLHQMAHMELLHMKAPARLWTWHQECSTIIATCLLLALLPLRPLPWLLINFFRDHSEDVSASGPWCESSRLPAGPSQQGPALGMAGTCHDGQCGLLWRSSQPKPPSYCHTVSSLPHSHSYFHPGRGAGVERKEKREGVGNPSVRMPTVSLSIWQPRQCLCGMKELIPRLSERAEIPLACCS